MMNLKKTAVIAVALLVLFLSMTNMASAQDELKPTIIWSLGEIADPESASFIYDNLKDGDLFVKIFTLRALRNFNDPGLLAKLKNVREENKLVRMYLSALLTKFGDEEGRIKVEGYLKSEIPQQRAAALNLVKLFNLTIFLDEVYNSLKDENPVIRRRAIEALKDIDQSERALTNVIAYLNDTDSEVRRMAMLYVSWADILTYYKKLPRKEQREFLDELRSKLYEEDIFTRAFAKVSLGKLGDRASLSIIRGDLESHVTFLRASSVYALAYARDFSVIPVLVNDLLDPKFTGVDRQYLIYAMKAIENYSYNEISRARRKYSNYIVYSLKEKEPNISVLIDKSATVKEFFINALYDNFSAQHSYAAEVLGYIADKMATPHLVASINDKDENLQISSVRSLGSIRDKEAATPLIEFFENKFLFKGLKLLDIFSKSSG
jgi:HEAT repeat protein